MHGVFHPLYPTLPNTKREEVSLDPKNIPSKHQTLERIWKTREWSLGSSIVNDSPTTIRGNWNEIHLGFCEGFPGLTGRLIQTTNTFRATPRDDINVPFHKDLPGREARLGRIPRGNFPQKSLIEFMRESFFSWLTIQSRILSGLYFIPHKKTGNNHQVIQFVTFLYPSWRSPATFNSVI